MKVKQTRKRDIEFLYEIGTLRFIDRTWKQFLPHTQNLTEHHFRVVWIALVLARMEGITNTEKVLKMALVHDLSESRTGDVNYMQRQYVVRDEERGIQDIFADTVLSDEFVALWKEYEDRKTIESRIVKDADNLDPDFEVQEARSRGNKVVEGREWKTIRRFVGEERLYTKSAKKLWKALQTSDPHDWHINGRNRFNSGDWKK